MKVLIHENVYARQAIQDHSSMFSIKDVSNLLLEMKELSDFQINIKQGRVGTYKITVGQSTYVLTNKIKNIYGDG
jgi:hypothetical protein